MPRRSNESPLVAGRSETTRAGETDEDKGLCPDVAMKCLYPNSRKRRGLGSRVRGRPGLERSLKRIHFIPIQVYFGRRSMGFPAKRHFCPLSLGINFHFKDEMLKRKSEERQTEGFKPIDNLYL